MVDLDRKRGLWSVSHHRSVWSSPSIQSKDSDCIGGGVVDQNIKIGELWDYFWVHRDALEKEYHMIASNPDTGVEVYLAKEKGFPCFSVEIDGEEVYTAETISSMDAEITYEQILTLYVYQDDGDDPEEDDVESDEDRITEITCAMEDLLQVLLDADPYKVGMDPQEVDELISIVEQHLHDDYGYSVRHPTEVDGVTVQYPFGDPNEDEDETESEFEFES